MYTFAQCNRQKHNFQNDCTLTTRCDNHGIFLNNATARITVISISNQTDKALKSKKETSDLQNIVRNYGIL